MQSRGHPEAADPIADEIHGVVGVDDALAEPVPAKTCQRVANLGASLLSGDDFQQPHHPHRIEKVGNDNVALQPLG